MQEAGIGKKLKRASCLRGPQSSSIARTVDDQTSEEDSSQVLRRQRLVPAKHTLLVECSQSYSHINYTIQIIDQRLMSNHSIYL